MKNKFLNCEFCIEVLEEKIYYESQLRNFMYHTEFTTAAYELRENCIIMKELKFICLAINKKKNFSLHLRSSSKNNVFIWKEYIKESMVEKFMTIIKKILREILIRILVLKCEQFVIFRLEKKGNLIVKLFWDVVKVFNRNFNLF